MIKQHIQQLIQSALATLQTEGKLVVASGFVVQVERTRDKQHGDFASNVAMLLAKAAGQNPRALAEQIIAAILPSNYVKSISIAGPGFINFVISDVALHEIIAIVSEQGQNFGRSELGHGRCINLEYVSSNPTGPLHVGHGRGAAYGASLANLLKAVGYNVCQEYVINDAGRQIDILAVSVWLRYLQQYETFDSFPDNGYQGEYVIQIAKDLQKLYGDRFCRAVKDVLNDIPADESQGGDKEIYIDALIARAKQLLLTDYDLIHQFAKDIILADMKQDLEEFGVKFDVWFSEQSLVNDGAVTRAIAKLSQSNATYERDGALWFNATHYGDEKDRVLVRANGQTTYFASDVAYHMNKFERGFDLLIDAFGADHHGYMARVIASVAALGYDPQAVKVLIYQFVTLYRGKERVPMSTRKGSFVPLRELRQEVGNDAARFFYLMRKSDQPIDFDLELAKSKTSDNPVYYVQYAYARICSVMRQMAEKGLIWDQTQGMSHLSLLQASHEKDLMSDLIRYPEIIETAAVTYEPYHVTQYLRELANSFHTYYNAQTFIVEEAPLRNARLCLIYATRQVLLNALIMIGVSAPEVM